MRARAFPAHRGTWAACAVLAALWLAPTALALAQGSGGLRYGGDSAFPPIEFLDAQGKPQGLQIDVLNEMARETGLHFDVHLGPWKEIEAAFRAGQIDAVSMSVVKSRLAWATFSPPHAVPALAVYYRRSDAAPQSLADLVARVVALEGSPPMLETRDAFFSGAGARVLITATPADALAAVRDGQADVAVMPRTYGMWRWRRGPCPSSRQAASTCDCSRMRLPRRRRMWRCASASMPRCNASKPRAACKRCASSGWARRLRTRYATHSRARSAGSARGCLRSAQCRSWRLARCCGCCAAAWCGCGLKGRAAALPSRHCKRPKSA